MEKKYIGMGQFSNCYLDEETNEVYKDFLDKSYLKTTSLKKLVNIKEEGFVFPNRLNGNKGYYMDYIDGTRLVDKLNSILFDDYLKMLKYTQKGLENLAKRHIFVNDTHYKNILVSQNELYHIDTDFYIINKAFKEAYVNYMYYNERLAIDYLPNGLEETFLPCKIDGMEMNRYFDYAIEFGKLTPVEFLEVLREYYKVIFGLEVTTIESFINVGKKVKTLERIN